MSETAFPVNDLLRRRLQTSLTLVSLIACVAATLFLLLLNDQVGSGITATAQHTLTIGYLTVFSQFLLFVGLLTFIVGIVIISFIVFLMMAQRTRDFGLMKATGCPNGLVFGYFFTELLLVTAIGCLLGLALGFVVDYAVINTGAFQVYQKAPNFWFAPLVFAAFFIFALVFGTKPMLNAARMSPVKALSPVHYFGLSKGNKFRPMSKSKLTLNIASRSLFRRQAATVRIVIFLSVVFTLLTVTIAGSIILRDTTSTWVERAVGKNVLLVAQNDMGAQYMQLLLKFSGAEENSNFNYLDPKFTLSNTVLQRIAATSGVASVDARLVWQGHVQEVSNFTVDPQTYATIPVGDQREGDALIVGVEPEKAVSTWYTDGRFLEPGNAQEAVVGDTVARLMYSPNPAHKITVSDPLLESISLKDTTLPIVGVCLDPINNGMVVYFPLQKLESIANVSSPNIVLVKMNPLIDRAASLAQLQEQVRKANPDLTVFDLNVALGKDASFLGSIWSAVLFLPLFCLAAAALCLVSYLMLSIEEQHQEFAVLRATGAKPKTVVTILSLQTLIVLLSSFAVGISIGTIVTLLILMHAPVVTSFTILQIAGWLLSALAGMFFVSLYPAVKFAKKPLLKIMS